MGATKPEVVMPPLEHAAFSIAEFCSRNHISRPMYHRMRSQGRGPKEMRIGLNLIRITNAAEREWQLRMQEPNADFERRATARAVKAGGRCSQKLQARQQKTGGGARSASKMTRKAPLARNIAEVIDDLYRQHASPRNHERMIELVQHQIQHAMRMAARCVAAPPLWQPRNSACYTCLRSLASPIDEFLRLRME